MWVIRYYLCLWIDATEHLGGRLVRRVLRHEFALHRKIKDLGLQIGNTFTSRFFTLVDTIYNTYDRMKC